MGSWGGGIAWGEYGVGGWVWHIITKFPHTFVLRVLFCALHRQPLLCCGTLLSIPRQHVDAIVFCYVGMNRK